jgi:hypothetical protein
MATSSEQKDPMEDVEYGLCYNSALDREDAQRIQKEVIRPALEEFRSTRGWTAKEDIGDDTKRKEGAMPSAFLMVARRDGKERPGFPYYDLCCSAPRIHLGSNGVLPKGWGPDTYIPTVEALCAYWVAVRVMFHYVIPEIQDWYRKGEKEDAEKAKKAAKCSVIAMRTAVDKIATAYIRDMTAIDDVVNKERVKRALATVALRSTFNEYEICLLKLRNLTTMIQAQLDDNRKNDKLCKTELKAFQEIPPERWLVTGRTSRTFTKLMNSKDHLYTGDFYVPLQSELSPSGEAGISALTAQLTLAFGTMDKTFATEEGGRFKDALYKKVYDLDFPIDGGLVEGGDLLPPPPPLPTPSPENDPPPSLEEGDSSDGEEYFTPADTFPPSLEEGDSSDSDEEELPSTAVEEPTPSPEISSPSSPTGEKSPEEDDYEEVGNE